MLAQEKLEAGGYYHIYNKAVGSELLFRTGEHYSSFLERYKKYLSDCTEVFAYCLMPNHFHFLVRIPDGLHDYNVSQRFSHLFNAHAQSYNKQYERSGSLFKNRFKRKRVHDQQYLINLLLYIHTNPRHHGVMDDFSLWPYSSYSSLLSRQSTILCRDEVISLFDGKEHFILCHQNKQEVISEELSFE